LRPQCQKLGAQLLAARNQQRLVGWQCSHAQGSLPNGNCHVVVGMGCALLEPSAPQPEGGGESVKFSEGIGDEMTPLAASPGDSFVIDVHRH